MRASTLLLFTAVVHTNAFQPVSTRSTPAKSASSLKMSELEDLSASSSVLSPAALKLEGEKRIRRQAAMQAQEVEVRQRIQSVVDEYEQNRAVEKARDFLLNGNGFYSAPKPDLFADDFVFRAPVVGPLCKTDYLETMNLFSLWDALPDMEANDFGWSVDPFETIPGGTTVRCFVRNTGTHTGPLNVGGATLPPTNKAYEGTVESIAVTLDSKGLVKCLTAGYVVDRFQGNGKGLGAVAGILAAIGLPVPKPHGKLFGFSQWLGNKFGKKFGPRTISKEKDVPQWWTSTLQGNQGL